MASNEENLHEIVACKTTQETFQALQKETFRLGLQNVSWVVRLPIPIGDNRVVTFNTYSQAWQERYWAENYLAVDPTIQHGMTSMQPMLWSKVSDDQSDFWEDARAHGLGEGIAQSMWDRQGCCSMLSLSRDGLEFTSAELIDKRPKISWLAQLAHIGMTRLILPREVPETAADLSSREKEILKLAAAGLTSQAIADRLNLTKRTADFHLENARGKLLAENRTDAVVRAIVLGLV
jgi:LuxR family quorum-sensing system transcriptional regulator SolR